MRVSQRLLLIPLAAAALAFGEVQTLSAQIGGPVEGGVRFVLPLDVSQGAQLDRGEPTPYTLSARLFPGLAIGPGAPVRVGAVAAVTYANPEWRVSGGGRVEFRIVKIALEEFGVFLGAELQRGTGDRTPATGSIVVDLDGIFRAGIWAGRDLAQDVTVLEASFGTDLVTLGSLLFGKEPDDVDL